MTFSPDGTRRRVHAATAYNMEYDPDRDLEVGATAAASGKAVTERRAAVADLVLLQITAVPAWGMQAAEQARVRPTLKSILSVPIFNPEDIDGPLLGTLQVDSDLTVEEAGIQPAGVVRAAAAVRRRAFSGARRHGRTGRRRPDRNAQDGADVPRAERVAGRARAVRRESLDVDFSALKEPPLVTRARQG